MAASSPLALALHSTGRRYHPAPHLRLLNRKLLDLASRKIRRLGVFFPPRHGKSTTCSHYFPTWYLGHRPDERFGLATYNEGFAATWGRKVRDSLNEHGRMLFDGVQVSNSSAAADEWSVAGHEGGMRCTGIGGGLTGRGLNVLAVDDPVKDAEEAMSPTIRQKHWDWYLSTADSRFEPNWIELLIMTRWHHDDLGGKILRHWRDSSLPHEILKLPALAKVNDPLGRPEGAALWPERFPVDVLEEKRRSNPFWWSALYDQNPTPEGGAIIKAEWLKRFRFHVPSDSHPSGWDALQVVDTGRVLITRDLIYFVLVDPALGKSPTGDDVAIGTFAYAPQIDAILVLHMFAKPIPVEMIVPQMQAIVSAWKPGWAGMEANGFQITVANSARAAMPHLEIRELEPGTKSKLARAVPLIERAARFGLLIPDQAPWVADYVEELTQWSGHDGDRDNQVDVTAYAASEVKDRYVGGDDSPMVLETRSW